MLKERIPIAKEGIPFWGIAAFFTLIFAILNWQIPAGIALAGFLFIFYFFRDPERIIPQDTDHTISFVSPADGRIVDIQQDESLDTFNLTGCIRISIFMNVFDVHVNRSPISGVVQRISYSEGRFLAADQNRAMLENEKNAILLCMENGIQCSIVQVAGLIARRIICWAEQGDHLKKGQRIGLIRFGSRVDVYIPGECRISVRKGQKVIAGQTVLAVLAVSATPDVSDLQDPVQKG